MLSNPVREREFAVKAANPTLKQRFGVELEVEELGYSKTNNRYTGATFGWTFTDVDMQR